MLLPTMRLFINYINGGAIYLSDLHPITYDTQEIENAEIDVIVWLIEEKELPYDFRTISPLKIKHCHYCLLSYPIDDRFKLYDKVFNAIYFGIDKGKNVLIVSRDSNDRFSILVSFFIQCLRWGERYLIHDFLNYIPKTGWNWTDSFLNHIQTIDPDITLEHKTTRKLYELEKRTIEGLNEEDS